MRSLATDLLWKIVNGEEIERGGKTHVASLRESLTAISLLGRMEGWFLRSEERKMKNEETKVKNEECSQPVSTAQSQPTLPEQTQYITNATQTPQ